MSVRATGLVLALWLIMAALLLSIAFNAAHFSPWEFLIPHSDPLSWVVPAILAAPPLLLAIGRNAPPRLASGLAWSIAAVLAAIVGTILIMFSRSGYAGS